MISQASKPVVLTICLLFMLLLTACSQPPNYAPVKTVNQAVEPDNGYVGKKSPSGQSVTSHDKQQPSAEFLHKKQEIPQKPVVSDSHHLNAYPNQRDQKPIPLQNKVESPPKSKPASLAVAKNQSSKPQKSAISSQKPIGQSKNKLIISSTNDVNIQKNTKLLDNLQLREKNNKKSSISIDNKRVLKLNFQWPLQGRISRNFSQTDNKGILITGKNGQAVRAAEAGKAVYCGQGLAGFGNLVIIKHNETYLSAYANNSRLYIKEGQRVQQGQTIGQVGATGLRKASLHFEIRKNGKSINPLTLLPKRNYSN